MVNQLTARFVVNDVTHRIGSEAVEAHAVYSDDPDDPNHAWSEATPSGSLSMHISNEQAFGFFKPGEIVEMTFRVIRE